MHHATSTVDVRYPIGTVQTVPSSCRPITDPATTSVRSRARWGDYSAAEDGTIWTATEWIPGTFGYPRFLANWGTFIGNVSP